MEYYALTDIGKIREKNQDQAATAINLKDQVLGVVCDGMGGHKAGEIASHVVEEHVLTCFKANPPFIDDDEVKNWLMDTVLEAHQIVKRMANMQENTKGMGTTVAICVVSGNDAFLCHVGDSRIYLYDEEEITEGDTRVVLHLHPALAPYKVAVLPLSKKLSDKAQEVYEQLSKKFMCEYDEAGSIGKRYRREDEIGTPYCVTVDFDTLNDNSVTIRDRDTMEQVRVNIDELENWISEKVEF